nr:ribonuclease H-like domain-containing protein [Tanacetum cinerariifolium]
MIRNKERLVVQGYTQEEGIDYDEVFAPVARIKAIMLFLAYASSKDFVVYQMDVKSAFVYGRIEEEVYVCQPLGFEDPELVDIVYKVENAVYCLHQAPRACQDKHVDEILKKFSFLTVKIASTPIETSKPLLKDENAKDLIMIRGLEARDSSSFHALSELPSSLISLPYALSLSIGTNDFIQFMVLSKAF